MRRHAKHFGPPKLHIWDVASIRPRHSPNPTKRPGSPHTPRITTSSPSSRNVRDWLPTETVSLPFLVCSSILPCDPGSVPEIVPLPSKSPEFIAQPLTE